MLGTDPSPAVQRPKQKVPLVAPVTVSKDLDLGLFIVVLAVLIFILVLLTLNLVFQHENYALGVQSTMAGNAGLDHAAVLAYSRAWDFAVVKTSSIFLAFTLILLGALYVLRTGSIAFKLSVSGGQQKGALETGSPGLVMVTLGVFLMTFVIYHKSDLNYGQIVNKKQVALEKSAGIKETSVPVEEGNTK